MKKNLAILIYGVEDVTHKLVGTNFNPKQEKKGNQEIENWIATQLNPRVDFRIHEFVFEGKKFILFQVDAAKGTPVRFKDIAYIRVGSYKQKLKDFPEKERKIWTHYDHVPFEKELAITALSENEVIQYLDIPTYYRLFNIPIPTDLRKAINKFIEEGFIKHRLNKFYITNLGAILFASDLNHFDGLKRKSSRVIQYKGKSRIETLNEQVGVRGYAVGFEGLITYITNRLPSNEEINRAIRHPVSLYPEIAIRELIANMLIHQDFSIRGTGPMVELFEDRLEITNPGKPIINTLRFIDHSPQSRNEELASFMRRIGICEERGSGIDKVISAVEMFQLPPPEFIEGENYTRVKLYAPQKLSKLDRKGKVNATYQHCVLKYVSGEMMTNKSLRARFNVEDTNYSKVSRIIREAINEGLIKDYDPNNSSRKYAKYVPFWV
ncbi:MAG: ATP-dependent DNA helicase RecG [Gammaproteobacteria bacterium]|jgi:ATP-dependent DNA helicase RecG